MPHVTYRGRNIWCPWLGCGFRIELVDFCVEQLGQPALYSWVMTGWGTPGFGLTGRCPGCDRHVQFSPVDKLPVTDPAPTTLPLLPDDWCLSAYIA